MKLFINRSMLAQRERERERESSLRTSSSLFKKSFTLIELSIVLLILSLLVGSLLVGRQIVDRAKIQRIIFEFDYYEKAFHQFYDTYRVVPGNFTYKDCIKHSEFQGALDCEDGKCPSSKIYDHQRFCSLAFYNGNSSNSKVIDSYYTSALSVMFTLKKAGLIDSRQIPNNRYLSNRSVDQILYRQEELYYGHFPYSTVDRDNYLQFIGFKKYSNYEINDANFGFIQRAWFLSVAGRVQKEFLNSNFNRQLDNKNVILEYAALKNVVNVKGASVANNFGAFDSKLTSELDAKIDDGRPGSGKLLALKAFQATKSSATENDILSTCYDGRFEDITSAIYNSSKNRKFGCNVMYVLERLG